MVIELPSTIDEWNKRGNEYLPGHLEMKFLTVEPELVLAQLSVGTKHMAWNGFLHAGTVVSLADTCCGYGTIASLPDGAHSFTTLNIASNFIGTVNSGLIECLAKPVHQGRTTQIWDAELTDKSNDRTIAKFRCTQMILWLNKN